MTADIATFQDNSLGEIMKAREVLAWSGGDRDALTGE